METLDKAEELDICPPGFECPEGNRMPFLCKEGSFCPREGMTKGEICPAGYHCPEGTIDVYSDDTLRLVFIYFLWVRLMDKTGPSAFALSAFQVRLLSTD